MKPMYLCFLSHFGISTATSGLSLCLTWVLTICWLGVTRSHAEYVTVYGGPEYFSSTFDGFFEQAMPSWPMRALSDDGVVVLEADRTKQGPRDEPSILLSRDGLQILPGTPNQRLPKTVGAASPGNIRTAEKPRGTPLM